MIKKELLEIRDQYSTPRRTTLISGEKEIAIPVEEKKLSEDALVLLLDGARIRRVQKRSGASLQLAEGERLLQQFETKTDKRLKFFTNLGSCVTLTVEEIPESKTGGRPTNLNSLFTLEKDETICSYGEKEALALEGDRVLTTLPFYAYLKIAEGCDNCCTYCAIPQIRGRFRSREIESVVSEAKALAKSGVSELVVVAQDTTRYGLDLYKKPMLAELLKSLNEIEGIKWIRVLYAYPEMVDDELLNAIASLDKVVKYIDIPIQHANGEVLRRMNRRGNREELTALIKKMREKIPGLVLRTTLIAGFPGETEEQFCELCEFLKENKIERVGCFAYSREEGTVAADFEDQIDSETAERRAEIIMTAQQRVVDEYNEKMLGQTLEVVVEGFDRYGECYFGRSAFDAPDIDGKVFFASDKPLTIGDFVNVEITEAMDYDLMGVRV
ncbi:MAG: 30S ribosomal protein S12 methylthiotransferase RimO [Oscillospiraceae bacterium]|nr:30S ribosomal protein S12 methylthiotransferase RimO [Oscillospiraceae bacterium]